MLVGTNHLSGRIGRIAIQLFEKKSRSFGTAPHKLALVRGGGGIELHAFLTQLPGRMAMRYSRCGFTPGKKTRYPLYKRVVGHQARSGQVRKISPPPGFDPQTCQPPDSRYTNHYPGPQRRKGCHKKISQNWWGGRGLNVRFSL